MIRAIFVLSLLVIGTFAKAESDDLAKILENAHMETNPNALPVENPQRKISGQAVDNPVRLELYNQLRDSNQMNAEEPSQATPDAD